MMRSYYSGCPSEREGGEQEKDICTSWILGQFSEVSFKGVDVGAVDP